MKYTKLLFVILALFSASALPESKSPVEMRLKKKSSSRAGRPIAVPELPVIIQDEDGRIHERTTETDKPEAILIDPNRPILIQDKDGKMHEVFLNGNTYKEIIVGEGAKNIWLRIKSKSIQGDSLQTQTTSYKVERSKAIKKSKKFPGQNEGVEQTVCVETKYQLIKKETEINCTVTRSLNGESLPKWVRPPQAIG